MTFIDPMTVAEKAMKQIQKGAFLTVRSGSALNTMTIGWATIGICWRQPILMVAVRNSRHTFGLIESAADFTVTVPSGDMREQLAYCGTRSGREVNKFEALSLATADARETISPVIDAAGLQFECRIVLKAPMDPGKLATDLEGLYPEKDYHTLYFGEIKACYEQP